MRSNSSFSRPRSFRAYAPISKFSCTVIWEKTRRPSGTWASPSRMILWALVVRKFAPQKAISPFFGFTRPEMAWSVVVLPAPFAPMSVTISPSFTSKEIPLIAWIAP